MQNKRMPTPSSSIVHWVRTPGYIKGQFNEPVCGIADKVSGYTSVNELQYQSAVNCEHCLYWLWDQEQPARKMDVDQQVVNMTFNNADVDSKIEAAIERGIKAGLEKVKDDFFESDAVAGMLRHLVRTSMREVLDEPKYKVSERLLVKEGIRSALLSGDVRKSLIDIHKIAEDEIDAEWDESGRDDEIAEDRQREIKDALREVLDEAASEQPVIHNFVQNLAPQPLNAVEIYRQAGAGVGTQIINVAAEVDPNSFRTMVREVMEEFDEDTADDYDKNETGIMQRALASIVVSEQFEGVFKKLVKDALNEKKREDRQREWDWHLQWYDQALTTPSTQLRNNHQVGVELQHPPEPIHYRRRYRSTAACGFESGSDTTVKQGVTCYDCRKQLGLI